MSEAIDQETRKKQSPLRIIILLLSLVFVLAMIAVPNFLKGRTMSGNACVNNLRQIAGAKNSWALENKRTAGTAISSADEIGINKYLRGERTPLCPSGGTIQYNNVGAAPTCTVAGHSI